jgi:hypothetical protein
MSTEPGELQAALDAWLARMERPTTVFYAGVAVHGAFKALSDPSPREHIVRRSGGLELVVRRPPAWSRYAPLGHFCVQLRTDGLSLRDVADVLGELPARERYKREAGWNKARDAAERRVGQRIHRFEALNPR